ncbi:ABC transporter ATP-binding protein (plasmid) [Deinococcus psychrotolerans]|uniref:ABC transporter ATP-binding protein n=1 Tax=Deinococcus psychrotolerans TaxID=2489213 RepID=A0A3G8YUK2_9DEIO|nr:ABC transporter ATP-binding protein [Deinococcus psychrotolerans]AZI44896.1 ABC transporter ATP-binding protein [Deinococcus psychrotolerans]
MQPESGPLKPGPLGSGPSEPQTQPLLALQNLYVNYGAVSALRGVSLHLHAGEVVALLGANGAGKSTTLRAISNLIKVASGQILLDGSPLTGLSPTEVVARGVAHCPEGRRVFGGMSVLENLRLGASVRSDSEGIKSDTERMLSLFPILAERRSQAAGTLSGGEQQMLALARALMARPRLLLLDEPSLGVAPLIIKEIFKILRELRETGVTILLVEQNARAALGLADRAYVLRTGSVALSGSAAELSQSEEVAQAYLGGGAA